MPRKRIADMIEELNSWLPNFDHGDDDYPVLLFRILASLPGGDRLEELSYEPFNLGWHEADQLARVLDAIDDKRDVEDRRRRSPRRERRRLRWALQAFVLPEPRRELGRPPGERDRVRRLEDPWPENGRPRLGARRLRMKRLRGRA